MPGQTVSAGVCLESFVVATTDKAFVPQFVDRTGKGGQHSKVRGPRTETEQPAISCRWTGGSLRVRSATQQVQGFIHNRQ